MDERRTEHYVQLISNASMEVFPDNVISEFTTQLAVPLRLTGKWDVGLHSCSYHRNWLNITTEEDATFTLICKAWSPAQNMLKQTLCEKVILPFPGNYCSPQTLLMAMENTDFIFRAEEEATRGLRSFARRLRDVLRLEFNRST